MDEKAFTASFNQTCCVWLKVSLRVCTSQISGFLETVTKFDVLKIQQWPGIAKKFQVKKKYTTNIRGERKARFSYKQLDVPARYLARVQEESCLEHCKTCSLDWIIYLFILYFSKGIYYSVKFLYVTPMHLISYKLSQLFPASSRGRLAMQLVYYQLSY